MASSRLRAVSIAARGVLRAFFTNTRSHSQRATLHGDINRAGKPSHPCVRISHSLPSSRQHVGHADALRSERLQQFGDAKDAGLHVVRQRPQLLFGR